MTTGWEHNGCIKTSPLSMVNKYCCCLRKFCVKSVKSSETLEKDWVRKFTISQAKRKWKPHLPPHQRSGDLSKHSATFLRRAHHAPDKKKKKKQEEQITLFTIVPHTPLSTQTIAVLFLPFRASQCAQQKGSLDEATLAVPPLGELRMLSLNVHTMLASGVK